MVTLYWLRFRKKKIPAVFDNLEQSSFQMIFPAKIRVSEVTPLGGGGGGFDLGETQDMARTLCDRGGLFMYTPEYPGC